jgi:hypothetical protein
MLVVCGWQPVSAYSVLTHEALIDVSWAEYIKPLLLKKYPGSTPDQLKEAHAYAYGGAVMPDMGYYPFGSKFFTGLVHYVRSGDFVEALLEEAADVNDYAFALGALCHYHADKFGHAIGTNHCVPLVYAKAQKRYGSVVTYEQDPVSHIRMEFGFDILQTASGNYASSQYHDFIGFKISRPLLERAFKKTYGIDINDVFEDLPLAISTFRWIIKDLFPVLTKAAWASKKKDIVKTNPGMTKRKFEFKMRKANYYHEYGKKHTQPGFVPSMLAGVIKVLPKMGPLKALKIKVPGPAAEKIFIQSFDTVLLHYNAALRLLLVKDIALQNIDFDTGKDTYPGEYFMVDQTYIKLLLLLSAGKYKDSRQPLKENILKFYGECNERIAAMVGLNVWGQMNTALDSLRVTVLPR